METAKILDTTVAETGPVNTINTEFLQLSTPVRTHCVLASGDVVEIQGRLDGADTWITLHTFNAANPVPVDIWFSTQLRATRTTDGAVGDSVVRVMDAFKLNLTDHA